MGGTSPVSGSFQRIRATLELESAFDGRRRVLSFRHVPGFDLIVAANEDHASWFAPWWRATGTAVSVMLTFLAILLGLLIFLLRELKQHADAEERYALVVRGTNDGIWDWDLRTRQGYLSQRWGEILGYGKSELSDVKDPLIHFIHPDDKARITEAIDLQLGSGDSYTVELRLRHKDGIYRWVLARGATLRDARGAGVRMTGSMTDITGRKNAEAALRSNAARIQDLLRRLVEAQEAERRRFAVDLHDLIGQNLSAVGVELERLRGMSTAGNQQAIHSLLDELAGLVARTMDAVRQVIADLRPALLDDYGLVTALKSHAMSVEHWAGLTVSVTGNTLEPRPAPETELALFRIAQEALMNSAKHAGASQVKLTLSGTASVVLLCVEDNGRGDYGSKEGVGQRVHAGARRSPGRLADYRRYRRRNARRRGDSPCPSRYCWLTTTRSCAKASADCWRRRRTCVSSAAPATQAKRSTSPPGRTSTWASWMSPCRASMA